MHNIFYLIKKIIAACSKNEIYNKCFEKFNIKMAIGFPFN